MYFCRQNKINKMEKVSYALGLSIANNFRASGIKEINVDDFVKGIEDVLKERKPEISYEEAQEVLNTYLTSLQHEQSKVVKEAGEEFLKINKNKPGVNVLPSGLQYQVLKEGNGKIATAKDTVRCHYHGTLIDGTVFDSSYDRGEPAEFGVTQVIAGWVEALQLMPEGSKWRLFVPSDLAYGSRGAGQHIQPDSTLIFDVEVLEVK